MPSIPAATQEFYWPEENAAPAHFISELTFWRRPSPGLYDGWGGKVTGAPHAPAQCLGVPHSASSNSQASPL